MAQDDRQFIWLIVKLVLRFQCLSSNLTFFGGAEDATRASYILGRCSQGAVPQPHDTFLLSKYFLEILGNMPE